MAYLIIISFFLINIRPTHIKLSHGETVLIKNSSYLTQMSMYYFDVNAFDYKKK